MGRRIAGRRRTHPRLASAVDAMNDLSCLAPISSPSVVKDAIATQVRFFDNRFVESLHDLEEMQSVAHKMKEDLMGTIMSLNEAGSLMRRAHQILLIEEDDDSQKINVGIASVELDVPPLVGEDSRAIKHRKSVVYFNQLFKELLDKEEIPSRAGHWQACPSSEGRGEGTSGVVVSNAESVLRGEVLRLSHLVEKKDAEVTRLSASLLAEREPHPEKEAIIDALANSHEGVRHVRGYEDLFGERYSYSTS
ncbi:hypothetical protein AAC387_Pa07g1831 [Persea americana]